MSIIKAEINNKSTLKKAQQKHPDTQICNCKNKKECLLNGQCLTDSIVHQVDIKTNIPVYKEKVYLGVSQTAFKIRYGNHKKSFAKQRHTNNM